MILVKLYLKAPKLIVPALKATEKDDNPKKKRQPTKKKGAVQRNKITSMFPKIMKTTPMRNEDNPTKDNPEEESITENGLQRCSKASMSTIAHQAKPSEYGDAT